MVEEHMPWPWLLLGILQDGKQVTLQGIYVLVEEDYFEIKKDGDELIDQKLLEIEPRYGLRPKYTHTVRGCLRIM